ncbi:MAG: molecular chaperone HtpG [Bacteroidota bacterium]|nr:molecular chaperone HtpG [Bacteroidota bacterium]
MSKTGSISVNTENIFPIIKKFLYSDHEIFLRELVSNATDACNKLKTLASVGEFKGETGDFKISITLDKDKKTLTISDNGIGMTEEEIDKYINQLAFSGAEEFVQKYKDKADANVIGHFGLGFYSAFMVASTVEINTLSFREDAKAAKWECDGSTQFKITKGKRKERGTDIILHIAEDSLDFLETYKISQLLTKYCKFLPVAIEFDGKIINEEKPLWLNKPADLKDEDYVKFYQTLYPFAEAPLFWIHLNVDFPFNLTGILYFPKVDSAIEAEKHKVQLYSNQVFVTDNVKDILPEFLMLLHGVIDSPDIPLNVSRSSLQSDGNVKKITSHITKKVADKLSELFKQNRVDFETKWQNVDLFVKYGMLSDEKFAEKGKDFCLLETTEGQYYTINDLIETIKPNQTDKDGNTIMLYTNHAETQHSYVSAANSRGYKVLKFEGPLDNHFTGYIEQKNEKVQCKRVDADALDKLIAVESTNVALLSEDESKKLLSIFEKANQNSDIKFSTEALSPEESLITVTESEYDRRMRDMSKMNGFNMFGNMPLSYQTVLNTNHPKAKLLIENEENEAIVTAQKALNLAMLSKGLLKGEKLTAYIQSEFEKL